MTSIERATTLKRHLATAKDFSGVMDSFFSWVEQDAALRRHCAPSSDTTLLELLGSLGVQILGPPIVLREPMLTEIFDLGLVHGTVVLNGNLTSVFYFRDIDLGMASISHSEEPGKITSARFGMAAGGRPN
jgi:hypothetical protein